MSESSNTIRPSMAAHAVRTCAKAALVAACALGTANATPPSGIITAPVLARGYFADATDVKFKVANRGMDVINARNAGAATRGRCPSSNAPRCEAERDAMSACASSTADGSASSSAAISSRAARTSAHM